MCLLFLVPMYRRLTIKEAEASLQIQDLRERLNLVQAEMEKEESAVVSFREKIINYSQLKGLTERLSMCLYLEETSKTLSAEVNRLFGSQGSLLGGEDTTIILYQFHSKTGELGISSSHRSQLNVNVKSKKGDIFDEWAIKTMQPLLIEDIKNDYRFDIDKVVTEDARPLRSLISVPLILDVKMLGILRIDSPRQNYFGTEDLRFLKTIGDLGSIAIENAQLYERVEQLAIKDGLTGLYLRRHLLSRLPEEIARQVRNKSELSFLMIDLDHFKQYNDQFGHTAGDIVLKVVGEALKETFHEPGSLLCRYGGEEFTVLLPNCSKAKAQKMAEAFRKRMEEEPVLLRREKTKVTVSVGCAAFPRDAQAKEDLIHKADKALYKAKEDGRNRVCST